MLIVPKGEEGGRWKALRKAFSSVLRPTNSPLKEVARGSQSVDLGPLQM